MKKNFYCVFGTNYTTVEIIEILRENFDMEFSPHESSYFGQYLLYSGLFADRITIRENRIDHLGEWAEERFKDYPTIIKLSNTNGKNSDKISKTNYIKKQFSKIANIALLEERVFEE